MITDKDMLFYTDTRKSAVEQKEVCITTTINSFVGQIACVNIGFDKTITSLTLFKSGSDKPVTISGFHIISIEVT